MILSGEPVRSENVKLLVEILGDDELGAKLQVALENEASIVALSLAERRRLVAVLDDPPWGLAELRSVLVKQLKQLDERARREQTHKR